MSLEITFKIPESQEKNFFFALREKDDFIRLLLETIKFISIYKYDSVTTKFNLVLKIDKMSRFIFTSPDKHFSIVCPFKIKEINIDGKKSYLFYLKDNTEISHLLMSRATGILNEQIFSKNLNDFIEKVFDDCSYIDEPLWNLLKHLYLLESGYLRFDHDNEGENGDIHPLNHLDIYYSDDVTFKIGLKKKITHNEMIDLLNNNLERKYLS